MLPEYLRDGPAQRRLLARMDTGHARKAHGAELGHPSSAAYRSRVGAHLTKAPLGFAVRDTNGRTRFLIADRAANQAAWINPGREDRSTFFVTWEGGVQGYVRRAQKSKVNERWQRLDLGGIRTAEASRAARRVSSAQRSTAARGVAR